MRVVHDTLLKCTEAAALTVRESITRLLHHLAEVQRRRLFARVGCGSLFDYCVRVLHMSQGEAARRVNASRALTAFPQREEKIVSGTLTVTAISQAQVFFKSERKAANPIPKERKQEILMQLENQSTRTAEKILLGHSSQPEIAAKERTRQITPTLTEVKCVLDEVVMADLERLKEIWSYALPNASTSDLIRKMAAYCRAKLDPDVKMRTLAVAGKGVQQTAAPALELALPER